ncbi:hypothetical protein V8F33_007600 [Rhypophila sp. PSN 637]
MVALSEGTRTAFSCSVSSFIFFISYCYLLAQAHLRQVTNSTNLHGFSLSLEVNHGGWGSSPDGVSRTLSSSREGLFLGARAGRLAIDDIQTRQMHISPGISWRRRQEGPPHLKKSVRLGQTKLGKLGQQSDIMRPSTETAPSPYMSLLSC